MSRIKEASENLTIGSLSGAKHVLKMCNCESINNLPYKETCRATSFTVYALKAPVLWDAGDGFDDKYAIPLSSVFPGFEGDTVELVKVFLDYCHISYEGLDFQGDLYA